MPISGKGLKKIARRAVLYAAMLLWAGESASAGSVQIQPVQDCSRRPRITVLRDGEPAAGIQVKVYLENPTAAAQKRVGRTVRTDARGNAVLPRLPRGIVHVVARWSSGSITTPDLEANLWVRYFPEDREPTELFKMDLQPSPNEQQYLEQIAKTAEAKPIEERLSQFGGEVVDPSGVAIPHVSIEVERLYVRPTRRPLEIRADAEGRFRAALPEGAYVAIFYYPGFLETVQTLVIDPAERQSEMRVALRLGPMSE